MQVPEVKEQGIGLEEGVGADDAPDALPPERRRRAEHRQVAHIHVHRGHRTTAAAAAAATARAASAISPTTAAAAAAAALRLFSTEAKGGGGQAVPSRSALANRPAGKRRDMRAPGPPWSASSRQ